MLFLCSKYKKLLHPSTAKDQLAEEEEKYQSCAFLVGGGRFFSMPRMRRTLTYVYGFYSFSKEEKQNGRPEERSELDEI